MSTLIGLPATFEFQTGFVMGLVGLAVTVVLRRRRLDWAMVWAACALGGLVRTSTFGASRSVRILDVQLWLLLAGLVVCAVAAVGIARGRAHPHLALGFIGSLVAVWASVPDTEAPTVLIGVTAAMVWSWWPLRFAFPRILGGGAATAIAVLSTIVGGGRREVAVVGGLGILASMGSLGLPTRWFRRASARIDIGLAIALVAIWFSAARVLSGPALVLVGGTVGSGLGLWVVWMVSARARRSQNQVEYPGDDSIPSGSVE